MVYTVEANIQLNPESSILIGVMVNNKNMAFFPYPRCRKLEMLCKDNYQQQIIFYYFTLKDIDMCRGTVNGVYYNHSRGIWLNSSFPFPHVLYLRNAVPDHRKAKLKEFFERIQDGPSPTLPLNSTVEFNKWHFYRTLCKEDAIKSHLPETKPYRNERRDLMIMLRRFGRVYLKGCLGKQGRQVMEITRLSRGLFVCRYYFRKLFTQKASRCGLQNIVNEFVGAGDFIIQQPLDLIEEEGCKVDLRAEVQRNGKGEIELVAVPVRVGEKNSPITTHARSYPFELFFSRYRGCSGADLDALKNRIDDFIVTVYESIEKHYGAFGEMGLDIGLDKSNKLWLIESNSQPSKVSLMKAYDGDTVTRALANPLEYALFLAVTSKEKGTGNPGSHRLIPAKL